MFRAVATGLVAFGLLLNGQTPEKKKPETPNEPGVLHPMPIPDRSPQPVPPGGTAKNDNAKGKKKSSKKKSGEKGRTSEAPSPSSSSSPQSR